MNKEESSERDGQSSGGRESVGLYRPSRGRQLYTERGGKLIEHFEQKTDVIYFHSRRISLCGEL